MHVAVAILELHIPHASSLKEKRSVVSSIRERLKNTFSCSVAEVALNDLHQRARLGIALVTSEAAAAETILGSIVAFVEEHAGGALTGWTSEILDFDPEVQLGTPNLDWSGLEFKDEEDT